MCLKKGETACPNCQLTTPTYTLRCKNCGFIRGTNVTYSVNRVQRQEESWTASSHTRELQSSRATNS